MVVHEDPGVDGTFGVLDVLAQALKEPGFVLCIAEDVRLVDPPDHDVVQGAGDI
jgi:hypothetical protein